MTKQKKKNKLSSVLLKDYKFLSSRTEIRGNYSIKNLSKPRNLLEEDEQLSLANNAMFKTMFQNDERTIYPAYFISLVLKIPLEIVFKDMQFVKNDLDKKINSDSGLSADCVIKLGDIIVNIEDNNTNKVSRNLEYLFRLYKSDKKSKRNYTYPKCIVQINLNNFELIGSDEIIEEYMITNYKNFLVPIVCYQIYLPKIIKLLYTGYRETMSELYRFLATMYTDRLDMAFYAADGFSIMVDYVKEAKIVTEEDIRCFRAYDHEAVDRELMKKDAIREGRREGRKEGREEERQNTLNAAKKFLNDGIDRDIVIKNLNLNAKEVKLLNL